jgi:hypothetical protein
MRAKIGVGLVVLVAAMLMATTLCGASAWSLLASKPEMNLPAMPCLGGPM